MKVDGEENQAHSSASHLVDPIHCERASLLQRLLAIVTLLGTGKSVPVTDDFTVQRLPFSIKDDKPILSQQAVRHNV